METMTVEEQIEQNRKEQERQNDIYLRERAYGYAMQCSHTANKDGSTILKEAREIFQWLRYGDQSTEKKEQ